MMQLTRVPNGPPVYLNQASLRADISPSRAVILGDQAVYSGVEALTNSMRGLGYEQKLRGFTAYLYGGKAVGTTSASFGSNIPRYDTELAGASLRTSPRSHHPCPVVRNRAAWRSSRRVVACCWSSPIP